MAQKRKSSVPVFTLYGEIEEWPTPDLIHCEIIAQRSRLHDWKIQPHRHHGLVQIVYMQAGSGSTQLDGDVHQLGPGTVLLVPEMCIHRFSFTEDVAGHVITLALPLVKQLINQMGALYTALTKSGVYSTGDDSGYINTLCNAISVEYGQPAQCRDLLLQSLVTALVVWISRCAKSQSTTAGGNHDRGSEYLTEFSRMIDMHFTEHQSIEYYADKLGLTASHLNSLCRKMTSRSALQTVHERLVLEAKRKLIYTAMTISQVSDSLGFSEPAYFTRFFKRHTNVSPKAFRSQMDRIQSADAPQ
jgi:AraC family transcriptional activator of pobA